jgi:hypothetical protein
LKSYKNVYREFTLSGPKRGQSLAKSEYKSTAIHPVTTL